MILRWAHTVHTVQLRSKASDSVDGNGRAYWAVTVARHHAEGITSLFLLNLHSYPARWEPLLSVFSKWGNGDERLIIFLKITQLVRSGAGIWTQSPCSSLICAASSVAAAGHPDLVQPSGASQQPVRHHAVRPGSLVVPKASHTLLTIWLLLSDDGDFF